MISIKYPMWSVKKIVHQFRTYENVNLLLAEFIAALCIPAATPIWKN